MQFSVEFERRNTVSFMFEDGACEPYDDREEEPYCIIGTIKVDGNNIGSLLIYEFENDNTVLDMSDSVSGDCLKIAETICSDSGAVDKKLLPFGVGDDAILFLDNIEIDEKYRNNGIATDLLKKLPAMLYYKFGIGSVIFLHASDYKAAKKYGFESEEYKRGCRRLVRFYRKAGFKFIKDNVMALYSYELDEDDLYSEEEYLPEGIMPLSLFDVSDKPFSEGGLSDKIYTAVNSFTNDKYYVKYGKFTDVITEVVFNKLCKLLELPYNETVIIIRDIEETPLKSRFIIGTREVVGKKWYYSNGGSDEILEQYIGFRAIKAFLGDDDSAEFILSDSDLYSIDNSESLFSDLHLSNLEFKEKIIQTQGEDIYQNIKKSAHEIATSEEVQSRTITSLSGLFKNSHTEKEFVKFKEYLKMLTELSIADIEYCIEEIDFVYEPEVSECITEYLLSLQHITEKYLESENTSN